MKYPAFVGPSYVSQSPDALYERCINFQVERLNEVPGGKNQFALYPTPGLSVVASAVESPGRGIFAQSDRCWAVIGQTVYEVSSSGVLTSRGAVLRDNYPATSTTNPDGLQRMFTTGREGYILDLLTHTLTSVVSDVTMCGSMNGWFIAFDIETSTIKISANLNGLAWDPTQFQQRSAAPDPWRSMLIRFPGIYLFGESTSDVWYDAGTFPFPFRPIQGVQIQEGIAASFSAANLKHGPCWLAQNNKGSRYVVQAIGYRTNKVSTHALDYALKSYATVSDATAFSYIDDGHEFYSLNFPSVGVTWVWDSELGQFGWHERGHWNSTRSQYEAWGPQYHAFAFGKHLVADYRTGNIYDMSTNYFADTDAAPIRRMRIAPALKGEGGQRIFYDVFGLEVETGVGLPSGQGVDPRIMLRYSNDAGRTWSAERTRSAGRQGEFETVVEWKNCGSSVKPRAFQVVTSDPVPFRIIDAYVGSRAASS